MMCSNKRTTNTNINTLQHTTPNTFPPFRLRRRAISKGKTKGMLGEYHVKRFLPRGGLSKIGGRENRIKLFERTKKEPTNTLNTVPHLIHHHHRRRRLTVISLTPISSYIRTPTLNIDCGTATDLQLVPAPRSAPQRISTPHPSGITPAATSYSKVAVTQ